ncbi:MAG: DUF4870 domain-containing protein [Dysgonamonadaceae bacterium]|jgi:uncharacterized Tic20 family protein|nr:DUF4870 domain-containing protein [Dysgonamonadaceae bacterium]MDD3356228.1 DUF4870 domain-containing protein [Dysgonamonadaceae bacterium]MDD3727604.1 DUF4870 domain-containing protein [Dysgonamonadaceae bacterium]MDD4246708.1 DUF4870 domain-containing protein [Dysgonamonadaceae bacterium]MDD4604757.1 DUF4870 domain-containing protein [Dysgonamonadaceae bacterium]
MKYENLKILDELRAKGSITEEEFQREKAKILAEENDDYNRIGKKPLFGMTEKTYLMLMHLSQFASWLIPFVGIIIPILMWTTNKDTNAEVDRHGKNILNFTISYAIYSVALFVIIIGIPLLIVLFAIYAVAVIIATIKASNGEYWKYPLTIQFIK